MGVMYMGTKESLVGGFDIDQWHAPVPILVIVGPLLGLVYIVVLPFTGLAILILIIGHRATQSLNILRRRSTHFSTIM